MDLLNLTLIVAGPFTVIGGLWKLANWSVTRQDETLIAASRGHIQVRAAEADSKHDRAGVR